jgi:repressor LexA
LSDELTDRQLEILRFIAQETQVDGFPPTIREIGDELGITSTNGVADHLKALVRKGFLELRPRARARGLKLTLRGLGRVCVGLCPTCHQPIRRAA